MVRPPVVAGQFYESDPGLLREQVKGCFLSEMGPGSMPKRSGSIDASIRGIIVPHAGLVFSGMCAAHAYKKVAESCSEPPVFLILGVNHTGQGTTSLMLDDWETPIGVVKVEEGLGKMLQDAGIPDDPLAHRHEHSIEVQLPFLQILYGEKARFVPLAMSDMEELDGTSKIIAESILSFEKETGRKVVIVASADLTHYGPNYGYVPFEDRVKEQLKELDQGAIKTILAKDPDAFIGYLRKTGATICGALTIPCLLMVLRILEEGSDKNTSGKLLQYYTSGDVLDDFKNSVSYASIAFSAEKE